MKNPGFPQSIKPLFHSNAFSFNQPKPPSAARKKECNRARNQAVPPKTFLLFYWNQLALSASPPPPLLGPILIILHNFAPSGPHLASLVAQFCICGPRRQPHSASQGIRGPLWASSGLVTSSKGTFLFIAINYQLSRKRISPQVKSICPGITFLFQLSTMPRNLRK